MTEYKEVSDKILDTYRRNWAKLTTSQKLHWYIRLYRINGETKYKKPIKSYFNRIFKNKSYYLPKPPKKGISRSFRKWQFYTKFPDVYFYKKEMLRIFDFKVFGIEEKNKMKKIKNVDWEWVIFRSGMLLNDPSEAVNLVYYLKYCQIADLEEKILKYFGQEIEKDPQSETEWKDLIYGLNHIVIAASYYYQRFLSDEKYDFIRSFFEENIREIIKNTSVDVVAETGVCLKLMGRETNAVNLAKDYVISKFDKKLGYIPKENYGKIGDTEHRNILAVMLFSDIKKLYKGPKFSN